MGKPKENGSVSIQIGGNVNGSQILASGGDINLSKTKINSINEINNVFNKILEEIENYPIDPNVEKEEIISTVDNIKKEVEKGEEAMPNKIERWFRFLAEISPDIFDIVVSTLANPIAGVGEAIRKIAKRAKLENT